MIFTSPLFDLEFEGEFSIDLIHITSARKLHGPKSVTQPLKIDLKSQYSCGRFNILKDDKDTNWYGEYQYGSIVECQIEMASYCLKEIALRMMEDITVGMEIDILTKS